MRVDRYKGRVGDHAKRARSLEHSWRRCAVCGRFVSYRELDDGSVKTEWEPYPSDETYFVHVKCDG